MKAPLLALIFCSFLVGCGCNTNRPSAKNNCYTDYVESQKYALKQAVFFPTKSSILIKIGEGSLGAVPDTLEKFQKNPAAWDVALLPAGTVIKVIQIAYTSSFDAGPHIWINANIVTGKLAGEKCLLDFISNRTQKHDPYIIVPMVDTNILEVISKP